jgi:hypothetical protein
VLPELREPHQGRIRHHEVRLLHPLFKWRHNHHARVEGDADAAAHNAGVHELRQQKGLVRNPQQRRSLKGEVRNLPDRIERHLHRIPTPAEDPSTGSAEQPQRRGRGPLSPRQRER